MAINKEVELTAVNVETIVTPGANIEANVSTGVNVTSIGVGGPRGQKGDRGAQGPQGGQGVPGTPASVRVGTTTTLPAGSDATVSNSGTDQNVVLNFGIPKGMDGGYTLPAATTTTLGGIKIGSNLSMDADDKLSAVVPTKTSDLVNDGSDNTSTYVEADELGAVATSNDYDDLDNKPTIPTVNDNTITITNNGHTVGTFTVNSSSDVTIALKSQTTSWGAYHEL